METLDPNILFIQWGVQWSETFSTIAGSAFESSLMACTNGANHLVQMFKALGIYTRQLALRTDSGAVGAELHF